MSQLANLANIEKISAILGNPTWDILVILLFLVVGFFYGLSVGKKRLLAVLFSLYVSILLLDNFYFLDGFLEGKEFMQIFLFKLFALLGLVLLFTFIFGKKIFRKIKIKGIKGRKKVIKKDKWWQVFVLSFAEVGLLMSAIFQLLPSKELLALSSITEKFFASRQAFLVWLVLPLFAILVILKKRIKKVKI